MKYLIGVALLASLAWGDDLSHDQFDAPAAGTMAVIGSGLVGIAVMRTRRRRE